MRSRDNTMVSPPKEESLPPRAGLSEMLLPNCELAGLVAEVLEKGVPVRFIARGASMSPIIRDGDTITLLATPGQPARLGEVVAYKQPVTGRIVVHRILGQTGQSVLLRGDNALNSDGLIPRDHILGRVLRVERHGRAVTFGEGSERWLFWLLFRWSWPRRLARRLGRLLRRHAGQRTSG